MHSFYIKKIHHPLNYVFILSLIGCLYLGLGHRALILLTLFIPLFFTIQSWRDIPTHYKIFSLLMLQYAFWHILKNLILDPTYELELDHPPYNTQTWVWGIVLALAVPMRFLSIQQLPKIYDIIAPVALILVFLAMTGSYYFFNTTGCRVYNYNMPVFTAPLLFTTLTLLLFYRFETKPKFLQIIAIFCVFLSIILSGIYAVTRGVLLAQIATYITLGLGLVFFTKNSRKLGLSFVAVTVFSVVSIFAIQQVSVCTFAYRLVSITEAFTKTLPDEIKALPRDYIAPKVEPAPSTETSDAAASSSAISGQIPKEPKVETITDNSVTQRLFLYRASLKKIMQSPIWGHGIGAEQGVIPIEYRQAGVQKHVHVHNMYLSWLIWGGVLSLISGLLFLLASPLAARNVPIEDRLISISAVFGVLGFSMLFDSFLTWRHYYFIYILLSSLSFFLMVPINSKNTQSTKIPSKS